MKKFFILLSVILCTVFVGCSKDSDNSSSSNSAIVGTWVYSESFYQITYTFNANGTFTETVKYDGEFDVIGGTYTYNAPELTLNYGDGELYTIHATVSGDTLSLSQDGMTIKFYRQ